ncbi:hypothetical protein DEI97_001890 [Curtobacterium sp. MCLR17_032]|uniref:hypothetical protein n=1 Tax=Curtobacterium sp. MCLR17_032 TaxID=2175650 RepID=UPI0011B465E3|nr:hypothetical protein [Curtobacterium sp. MCLR17_032]WIE61912.1 hypothetical protein DEI97_001890 [Curtobacterium sp. MCLR17_032]
MQFEQSLVALCSAPRIVPVVLDERFAGTIHQASAIPVGQVLVDEPDEFGRSTKGMKASDALHFEACIADAGTENS